MKTNENQYFFNEKAWFSLGKPWFWTDFPIFFWGGESFCSGLDVGALGSIFNRFLNEN